MIPNFRAWDKNLKLIRKVSDIDFQNQEVGFYVDDYEGEDYIPEFEIARNFDEVELMQSTGLKDKNRIEIFQGDIVKNINTQSIGRVFWDVHSACWYYSVKQKTTSLFDTYTLFRSKYNLEIIGNIYENPELFEVEK